MKSEDITKRFLSSVKKIGIERLEELPLYLPSRYKDYSVVAPSISMMEGSPDSHLFKLQLLSMPERNYQKGYVKLFVSDGYDSVSVFFFNNSQRIAELKKGDVIHIEAKVERKGQYLNLSTPEFVEPYELGKVVPVYKGEKGIVSPYLLAKNIKVALLNYFDEFKVFLYVTYGIGDNDIVAFSSHFKTIKEVFNAIHNPNTSVDAESAMDVIRVINAKSALRTALTTSDLVANSDSIIRYTVNDIKFLMEMLPYNLTPSQKQAIWEITKDLNSEYPMDRLLSGDVGFGKTLTYAIPAVCAHKSGKATVILTPNTLLAIQIADEIRTTFAVDGVRLVISDDEPRPSDEDLKSKPIIVGTSAILHWLEAYDGDYTVDFLIVDEQQKLGNQQKMSVMKPHTNFLEATATSIPRTTALVVYGNKKVSYLTECPVEKSIKTMIAGKEHQKQVMKTLRKIVEVEKKQIAVLYPVREKDYTIFDIDLRGQQIEGNVLELIGECTREGVREEFPR
ncbi:DEAD/DEAH box helicase, partial [Vibrio splendidus]